MVILIVVVVKLIIKKSIFCESVVLFIVYLIRLCDRLVKRKMYMGMIVFFVWEFVCILSVFWLMSNV